MQKEKNPSQAENDGDDNLKSSNKDIYQSSSGSSGPDPSIPLVDNFSGPAQSRGETVGEFKMPEKEKSAMTIEAKPTPSPTEPSQSSAVPIQSELEKETLRTTTPPPDDVFEKKTAESKTITASPPTEPATPSGKQEPTLVLEKRGYGWLGVIIALLIVILLGVVIAINELGILNLGLEKYYGAIHLERLWGGLPSSSKTALGMSYKSMEKKSFIINAEDEVSYTLTGTAQELSSTTASPTVSPVSTTTSTSSSPKVGGVGIESKRIVNDMKKEGVTAKTTVKLKGRVQNFDNFEIGISAQIVTDSSLVMELIGGDNMVDLTLVNMGSDIYIANPALQKILANEKEWVKVAPQEGAETNVTGESAADLSDIISGGERTGSAKVNGVSCYIYDVKVNALALSNHLNSYSPNYSWLAKNLLVTSAKFWIGKRDHLIYKIELSASSTPGDASISNKITASFSDFGTGITITAPAEGQYREMKWADIKNAFISGEATTATSADLATPEQRDKKRKEDLISIQNALIKYKADNEFYPSTAGAVEKTLDEISKLKTALVPKYLSELPVDPLHPKYYYGYKSADGTRCDLTAVLENKLDPDGEQYDSIWIYHLKGN